MGTCRAGAPRVLIGALRRRLREEAQLGEFTLSQMSVLSRLAREGPATVTQLARAEGIRPQSMGATIAGGYVSGETDSADDTKSIWSLTDESRAWIRAHQAAREDWLFRAIRTKRSLSEQKQLGCVVALLNRLMDP